MRCIFGSIFDTSNWEWIERQIKSMHSARRFHPSRSLFAATEKDVQVGAKSPISGVSRKDEMFTRVGSANRIIIFDYSYFARDANPLEEIVNYLDQIALL